MRVLTVNTQFMNPLNFWAYSSKDDLSETLQWVEKQFQLAKSQNQKILLSGHIPPGQKRGSAMPESLNFWNAGLEALLVKYPDLVVGSVWGHTHQDDFALFHDYSVQPPKPTLATFVAPSVTPYGGNHYPSVRKFYYDRTTGALLDHETCYNNLTDFHQKGGHFNDYWKREYSACEAWGLNDLSPIEVQNKIYNPLWNNNVTAWQQFMDYFRVLYPATMCRMEDLDCRKKHLCSMGHLSFDHYLDCATSKWPLEA